MVIVVRSPIVEMVWLPWDTFTSFWVFLFFILFFDFPFLFFLTYFIFSHLVILTIMFISSQVFPLIFFHVHEFLLIFSFCLLDGAVRDMSKLPSSSSTGIVNTIHISIRVEGFLLSKVIHSVKV